MKRREFLNIGLLTLGGVLVGRNFAFADALTETQEVFRKADPVSSYDMIINGAGLCGFFIALEAVKKGLKVLIVDKRTSPGFDIAAKRKLWLSAEGLEEWDKSLLDLFFPTDEQEESLNNTLESPRRSRSGNELLLFAGSIKKGMLRSLLVNQVDVLLMNDVCGILTNDRSETSGVLVASKHGVFSIPCRSFVDATDGVLFTRELFALKYQIREAGFVLEMDSVRKNSLGKLHLSGLNLLNDTISVHAGKKDQNQYFVEYRFATDDNDLSHIEQRARLLSAMVSKQIREADPAFSKARTRYAALECSLNIEGEIDSRKIGIKNYYYMENSSEFYTCKTVCGIKEQAKSLVEKIEKSPDMNSVSQVYYIGGKAECNVVPECYKENGFMTPLSPFPIDILKLDKHKTALLVAGAGTAGAMAALSASQKQIQTVVIEYFNELGGTKTVAGVNGYYRGYQEHKFIKELEQKIKTVAAETNLVTTLPRSYYYLQSLLEHKCKIINGAILCAAEVDKTKLKSVTVCQNGRLYKILAELTIDATGDGDVAYFAGENYSVGDSRMGITQNYSHWDIPFKPKIKDYNRDYDIINNCEILETQRGLYLSHYESHFYDFYPMLAIRESRRINAVYNLSTRDIISDTCYEDTIAQARSDYDPHYFSSSESSRCGFMLPHFDNMSMVNIPYRSIVPRKIDGLLLSGKSIGQSYKALQFTRMSADITVLGYVTGMLAAQILKKKCNARELDITPVQKELIASSYLPADATVARKVDLQDIVDKLSTGDETVLFKCCMQEKKLILPLLQVAFEKRPEVFLAKALAWFGDTSGSNYIIDELKTLYRQEQQEGHAPSYFEKYDDKLLYWQINKDIALLGMMPATEDGSKMINYILEETKSGGEMVVSDDAYTKGRIDLQLIPYYNRIVNLCFYLERNPDVKFIENLEKLMDDPNIKGYKTSEYNQTRWRIYGANLELLLAAAAIRCGSMKGTKCLISYLEDIHSNFRYFSRNELCSVYGKDGGYDRAAWCKLVKDKKSIKVSPLKKSIEV